MRREEKYMCVLAILLFCTTIFFEINHHYASVEDDYNYGAGSFYTDIPEARENALGAAGYFHIFANHVFLRSHTNGNIATQSLDGKQASFGTNNYSEKEINYIQSIQSINSSAGIAGIDHNKFVVGKEVSVDRTNPNRPKVDNTFLDHIKSTELFQDSTDEEYLSFSSEFHHLYLINHEITKLEPQVTIHETDFSDRNNRLIDIQAIDSSVVIIYLSKEVLEMDTPLIIKGLSKEANDKTVIITVDMGDAPQFNCFSQIKLIYSDGSERANKESVDFSDSTLLWNFTSNTQVYDGTLFFHRPWQGTILAPGAKLDGTGINIDGSIIVDQFLGAGETHRWDWQGTVPKTIIPPLVTPVISSSEEPATTDSEGVTSSSNSGSTEASSFEESTTSTSEEATSSSNSGSTEVSSFEESETSTSEEAALSSNSGSESTMSKALTTINGEGAIPSSTKGIKTSSSFKNETKVSVARTTKKAGSQSSAPDTKLTKAFPLLGSSRLEFLSCIGCIALVLSVYFIRKRK